MKKYQYQADLGKQPSEEEKKEFKKRLLKHNPKPYHFEEYVPDIGYVNKVRDFATTMGDNTPTERFFVPPRYDMREVMIDNDADVPVEIRINNSPYDAPKEGLFILQPKEFRFILINSYGGSPQYIGPVRTRFIRKIS